MAQLHVLMGADTVRVRPAVRSIGLADLKDALACGLRRFFRHTDPCRIPCLIYPIVGLVLARRSWLRPVAAPVSARRWLCAGRPVRGHRLLRAEPAPRAGARHFLGGCFRRAALALARRHCGARFSAAGHLRDLDRRRPGDLCRQFRLPAGRLDAAFHRQVFTTPEGWMLIIVGNFVGFLFAAHGVDHQRRGISAAGRP